MNGIVLAAALAVALALAGLAWIVRRGRDMRIASAEEAAEAADLALAGFRTAGAVVGSDGAAALVVDGEGRVAVCRRRGARVTVREVGWTAIRATAGGLAVDTGETRTRQLVVRGVDALDVRRLAPQLTRA